ncbi:MAG TPA: Gfo/Idh/MocA family oxidoreductase [Pyrinomonadaceae bacterium]|nr:Gfo/Idh/MocA family oxidoreductase [Pyrinomonadaceae bacterium]
MIRLGVIGCGGVTEQRHLPALRQVSGVKVVALADIDSARLERVAEQFGVARRYTAYSDLIESNDVDAVAVCVPPRFHAEIALATLEAGKHVLIEKPLALNLSECDLLSVRATAHSALKVMVGFNMRWHRLVREAREVISSGELGDIKLVRTVFTSGVRLREDFADWRKEQETGGGALFELGVHHFDLLRFLLRSEAEEVYAASASEGETACVLIRMKCGAQVLSAFSEGTGENHAIEVYGARGWLRISCYRADGLEQFSVVEYTGAIATRLRKLAQTFLLLPRMLQQARQGGDHVASYAEEWRHFVGAITRDSPVECALLDGRRALEVALAAQEASATKRAVKPGCIGTASASR